MKIIGIGHRDSYLCEVSHSEIEKFLNLYYGNKHRLKVGEKVDLGKGHDFASDAQSACRVTREFIEKNGAVIRTIMDGITFLGTKEEK